MGYSISEIDALEHDTLNGTYNSMVQIDDTHYILAYAGDGYDATIKTFSIDSNNDNITQIDSLVHDTTEGYYNSIIKIDSTHYALAYGGASVNSYIKIFTIDGSYNLTQTSTITHDSVCSYYNSLTLVDSTHLVLAYSGLDSDGYIKTFSIDGSYNVTEIDNLEHDTGSGTSNSLVKIDSTHFALAYAGDGGYDGWLKIFTLDGSYNITQTSSLEHDTQKGNANSLVLVDSSHLILAYQGTGTNTYQGFIKTFSFDGSYNITEIDSLEHENNVLYNSLVEIIDGNFVLANRGTDSEGFIKLFTIDGSYNITEIDSLEHDATDGAHNSLVKIDDGNVILAYAGVGSDGFIKTFNVGITEETETATFTELTPTVSGNADPLYRLSTQAGTTSIPAGSLSIDETLTTNISDLSRAFIVMQTAGDSGANLGSEHQATGYLWDDAGTTKIKFERNATTEDCQISYYVVETNNEDFTVQRGNMYANVGNLTNQTYHLQAPIDQSRTHIVSNSRSTNTAECGFAICSFVDNDTVEMERNAVGSGTYVRFEVVEWTTESGVTVSTGEQDLSGNIAAGVSTDITAHGITKAYTWLFNTFRHATNGLEQTAVCTSLTSDTAILWQRYDETVSYVSTGRYWLVEFPSDVSVQHSGVVVVSTTTDLTSDFTVTEIDQTKAWADHYNSCNGTGTAFPRTEWIDYFTSNTNLRMQRYYNGQAAEIASQVIDAQAWTYTTGVTTKIITETASGVDVISIDTGVTLKTISETGSGTDIISILSEIFEQDSGIGTDIISILSNITIEESANGTDVLNLLSILQTIADTGNGAEIIHVLSQLTISDSTTGLDTLSTLAQITLQESGSGTDLISLLSEISLLETSSGVDIVNTFNEFTITDSSNGTEVISRTSSGDEKSIVDSGVGVDILFLLAELNISDVGTVIEILNVLNQITITETTTANDIISSLITLSVQDTGNGDDLLALLSTLNISDTATGNDVLQVLGFIGIIESATGEDIGGVLSELSVLEEGAGVDEVTEIFVQIGILDNTTGTDYIEASFSVFKTISDDGTLTDTIAKSLIEIYSCLTGKYSDKIGRYNCLTGKYSNKDGTYNCRTNPYTKK